MDRQTREQIDSWIVGEILKAKAIWMHACYASIFPRPLYKKAAADDLAEATEFARKEGYSFHEFSSPHGGETQLHKNGLIVGKFKPVLVEGPEHPVLTFDAYVFDKRVPVASLAKHLDP